MEKAQLNIPQFYYVSSIHNNKYYIIASNGVYTLEKGEFPEILFIQNIKELEYGLYSKEIFSNNNNYFILIVPTSNGGSDSPITYGIVGYLVDFTNNSFINLRYSEFFDSTQVRRVE